MTPGTALCSTLLISGLKIALSYAAGWYLLATLAAGLVAFLVYRFTIPPVTKQRRTLLWLLRAAALALLLLLLCEPVLSYFFHREQEPTVAVLVDRSASMKMAVGPEDREAEVQRFLSSRGLRELAGRSRIRVFGFSDTTFEATVDSLRNLVPVGIGTNLSGAWTSAERLLAGENLSAVVLVSDGAHTVGENPVRAAQASAVPIFALGVGDTSRRRDASIGEILTNEIAYSGSRVPVDIRVRALGLAGRETTLKLVAERGTVLAREIVRFAEDDDEVTVSANFEVGRPGEMRVTAVLDSLSGEVTLDNNRRSVIVKVLEGRSKVVVIAGAPSPDLTVLRQTLESDTSLDVATYVEGQGGRLLYGTAEPTLEYLGAARSIVLMDFPTRASSASLLNAVTRAADEHAVPLFFFAGPNLSPVRFEALSALVAVRAARPALSEELVTTRGAEASPILSGATPLPAEWSDLPPTLGGNGNFTANLGAQVVAKLSREAIGIAEEEPGVVVWQSGRRRGAALLCWQTARWKLQLAGTPAAGFYEDFVLRVTSWLIAPAEERRVKIRTTKKLYSGGERVRFVAEVYGSDLAPRNDAVVAVRVDGDSRSESVSLRGRGNGRYEGEFLPWADGDYRFVGAALVGTDSLGSDHGLFAIEPYSIELRDTRARFDLLQGIAGASRGGFAPAANADSLLAAIPSATRTATSQAEIPLWNRGLVFWIVILLLSLEWIIRKRSGML